MSTSPTIMEVSVLVIRSHTSSSRALCTSQIKNQDPSTLLELIKLSEIMLGPIWSCTGRMARAETPISLITTVASLSMRALTSSADINKTSKDPLGTILRPSPGLENRSHRSVLYVTNQMQAFWAAHLIASKYIIDKDVKRRIWKKMAYARKAVRLKLMVNKRYQIVMLNQGRRRWDTIEHKASK